MECRRVPPTALRRQSARRTLAYAAVATAFVAGLFAKTTFTEIPATSVSAEQSRRSAILATGLVATPDLTQTEPALSKLYIINNAFNISFPSEWEVLAQSPYGVFVQADKKNVAEKMSAAAREEKNYNDVEGVLGDPKEYGKKLAEVMPAGAGRLVDAQQISLKGQNKSAYQIELANDYVHEKWFIAVVDNGQGGNNYCSVALRTTPASWDGRKAIFDKILSSFTPYRTISQGNSG
mmetsp:Transcript_76436/g.151228  ORF Transcript_76436/g.151228 Transcript_76436/m.151228 type:complete len:236 (+) Transcript_76436:79-786(+)